MSLSSSQLPPVIPRLSPSMETSNWLGPSPSAEDHDAVMTAKNVTFPNVGNVTVPSEISHSDENRVRDSDDDERCEEGEDLEVGGLIPSEDLRCAATKILDQERFPIKQHYGRGQSRPLWWRQSIKYASFNKGRKAKRGEVIRDLRILINDYANFTIKRKDGIRDRDRITIDQMEFHCETKEGNVDVVDLSREEICSADKENIVEKRKQRKRKNEKSMISDSAIEEAISDSTVLEPSKAENTLAKQGENKIEQLTSQWIRSSCERDEGSSTSRGDLYATYVDDMRNVHHSLSGSLHMFTNMIKTIFSEVEFKLPEGGTVMVVHGLRLIKPHKTSKGGEGGVNSKREEKKDNRVHLNNTPHVISASSLLPNTSLHEAKIVRVENTNGDVPDVETDERARAIQ